jgi:hypothetical protein
MRVFHLISSKLAGKRHWSKLIRRADANQLEANLRMQIPPKNTETGHQQSAEL